MQEDKNYSKMELIFADDIMTDNVAVIKPDMLIGQVAHRMLRERVSGYPIVDEQNHVIGIVTLTDLFLLLNRIVKEVELSALKGEKESLQNKIEEYKNLAVSKIMSTQVVSISPATPLNKIIEAVVSSNIHTFPVMENNKLVGIIGRHDVLNATFVYG